MTLYQYQKLSSAISGKCIKMGLDPRKVKTISLGSVKLVDARDPKKYANAKNSAGHHKTTPGTFKSGECNAVLRVTSLSNPANPNYKYGKLKPGSIAAHDASTGFRCDLADYNFDSRQFSKLVHLVDDAKMEN